MEKQWIQKKAKELDLDMSVWVKQLLFSQKNQTYMNLMDAISNSKFSKEALAHFNDFLDRLPAKDFVETVMEIPGIFKDTFHGNYIAAMVEMAAHQKKVAPPSWTKKYTGMEEPYFASSFENLRFHLLVSSPIPFRKRNIFIDSTIGDRI